MNWLQKLRNRFVKRKPQPKFIPPKDAKRTEWREFKPGHHGKGKQIA